MDIRLAIIEKAVSFLRVLSLNFNLSTGEVSQIPPNFEAKRVLQMSFDELSTAFHLQYSKLFNYLSAKTISVTQGLLAPEPRRGWVWIRQIFFALFYSMTSDV